MQEHQHNNSTRSDLFPASPLEQVREGMTVLDTHSARLGKIKRLRMGDPEAVTTAGQSRPGDAITVAVAPASNAGGSTGFGGSAPVTAPADEPDVPDPLRTRLRRVGFIELEDSELHGADAYIPGDRISHVREEVVYVRMQDASTDEQSAPAQFGSVTWSDDATSRRTIAGKVELTRERMAIGAGGGLALATAGGAVGFWQYRQRQRRQRRIDARAKRWVGSVGRGLSERNPRTLGGVGGAVLLAVLMRALLGRRRADTSTSSALESGAEQRTSFNPRTALGGAGAALLIAGLLARRVGRRDDKPTYIGTPGVESASGRDRIRSGELPPEFGTEHGRG